MGTSLAAAHHSRRASSRLQTAAAFRVPMVDLQLTRQPAHGQCRGLNDQAAASGFVCRDGGADVGAFVERHQAGWLDCHGLKFFGVDK